MYTNLQDRNNSKKKKKNIEMRDIRAERQYYDVIKLYVRLDKQSMTYKITVINNNYIRNIKKKKKTFCIFHNDNVEFFIIIRYKYLNYNNVEFFFLYIFKRLRFVFVYPEIGCKIAILVTILLYNIAYT